MPPASCRRLFILSSRPSPVARFVGHTPIKSPGYGNVPLYLGAAHFRSEETEQRQLFHHGEIVGRATGVHLGAGLLVQSIEQVFAFMGCQGGEIALEFDQAILFEFGKSLMESRLLVGRVAIVHIDAHKLADFRILGAGGIGAGQDGFGDLIQQRDFGIGKGVAWLCVAGGAAGQQARAADQGGAGGGGDKFQQVAAVHHRFPLCSSLTAWSTARAVSAM